MAYVIGQASLIQRLDEMRAGGLLSDRGYVLAVREVLHPPLSGITTLSLASPPTLESAHVQRKTKGAVCMQNVTTPVTNTAVTPCGKLLEDEGVAKSASNYKVWTVGNTVSIQGAYDECNPTGDGVDNEDMVEERELPDSEIHGEGYGGPQAMSESLHKNTWLPPFGLKTKE